MYHTTVKWTINETRLDDGGEWDSSLEKIDSSDNKKQENKKEKPTSMSLIDFNDHFSQLPTT